MKINKQIFYPEAELGKDIQHDDIIEIIGEVIIESELNTGGGGGKYYFIRLPIQKTSSEEMLLSIPLGLYGCHGDVPTLANLWPKYFLPLVETWGDETENWIGRKIQICLENNEIKELKPIL